MNNIDFSPLFRSSIGFDRVASLLDAASRTNTNTGSYPPYNIEAVDENHYKISLAVAGFSHDDLNIETENNLLTITGRKEVAQKETKNILYQGIAARNFERKFQIAEHVEVSNAQLENGLLLIDLVREIPEAMKPKSIKIKGMQNNLENQTGKAA